MVTAIKHIIFAPSENNEIWVFGISPGHSYVNSIVFHEFRDGPAFGTNQPRMNAMVDVKF
jgi:hypothetical protein